MTNRSLLDYLGEPADPAVASNDQTFPVDQLRARLADLEARLNAATHPAPAEEPEQPLATQIQSILKRRDGLYPAPGERQQEQPAQPPRSAAVPRQRLAVEAPSLSPDAFASSGDFGRFVDAVQTIARAADRFMQQPATQVAPPAPKISPYLAPQADLAAVSDGLRLVLGALHDMTGEFRSAAEEMRRAAHDSRRHPDEQPYATRRVNRDDAELFRLQDDLDALRDRLGALTHRRSRNPS